MELGFFKQTKKVLGSPALWAAEASILVAGVNFLGLKLYPYPDDSFLPLHYNLYFGIDYLGEFKDLYSFPMFGLIALAINLTVAASLAKKIRILSYALIYTALLIQVLILISLILIVLRF